MKFTAAVSAAALVAGASAYGTYSNGTEAGAAAASGAAAPSGGVAYVTDVVTAYTTYCPYATKVTANGAVYTVSEVSNITPPICDQRLTDMYRPLP